MAYNIFTADGTAITVPDNAISNEFYNPTANGTGKGVGLQLVGRNVVGYGAAIAQDLLQMASNFASTTAPGDTTSMQGQLWFNLTDLTLYIRSNVNTGGAANWKQVGGAPLPQVGEPLYDITDVLLGYSTPSIPTGSAVASYVPLHNSGSGVFSGWLKVAAGSGMTSPVYAIDGVTVIGYSFPA